MAAPKFNHTPKINTSEKALNSKNKQEVEVLLEKIKTKLSTPEEIKKAALILEQMMSKDQKK